MEHVLCVPTAVFHDAGHFEGFCSETSRYVDALLNPATLSYQPRNVVEEDPGFKQLIPYCVFRHAGEVFYYVRGKSGGEARLHARRSVGVGGHISSEDGDVGGVAYEAGMRRELAEEVATAAVTGESLIGLINDDSNDVGRVHLGLVHVFDLDAPQVSPREESIQQTGFAPPAALAAESESFESWSQIVLRHLATSS